MKSYVIAASVSLSLILNASLVVSLPHAPPPHSSLAVEHRRPLGSSWPQPFHKSSLSSLTVIDDDHDPGGHDGSPMTDLHVAPDRMGPDEGPLPRIAEASGLHRPRKMPPTSYRFPTAVDSNLAELEAEEMSQQDSGSQHQHEQPQQQQMNQAAPGHALIDISDQVTCY
jgi:hypothetical protein